MSEINQTDDVKTVKIDFGSMMQSKPAQQGIMNDIAASKSPEIGKAIPKEK